MPPAVKGHGTKAATARGFNKITPIAATMKTIASALPAILEFVDVHFFAF